MVLKDAKCPNCGGVLKLNPDLEKGTCNYCGSEFIVSDAIQRFKGEIDGIATTKQSLIRARQQREDGDFDGAMKSYKHVIETNPTNAEAYYGMFECSLMVAEYYRRKNAGMQRTAFQYYDDVNAAINKYGLRAVEYADEPEKSVYSEDVNSAIQHIQSFAEEQSQQSSGSGSGGCYVATAVYGSYDCPEVWTLRRFRDNTLAATWYGRAFIRLYYTVSPQIVKYFGDAEWFSKLWRPKLDALVDRLRSEGVEGTPYQDIDWR